MPKASVDEDARFRAGKDEVRLAGEISVVQPESEPFAVQKRAHQKFWGCVPAADTAHIPAASFGG